MNRNDVHAIIDTVVLCGCAGAVVAIVTWTLVICVLLLGK